MRWRALLGVLTLAALPAYAAPDPGIESTTGLVVADQRLAAEAGVDILRMGGNAMDAAVAVGYAEAVVNPCCGNIGGGGFLTAHMADGRNVVLDFRETAPAGATKDMYLDQSAQVVRDASLFGWKAVAVPGTVLGLDTALTEYGTLPRGVVMAAAIRLANEGFPLTSADAEVLAKGTALLRRDANAAAQFLHPDGLPYRTGETLRQPVLAATLQAIADRGPDAFYQGRIPAAIETASHSGGGVITAADFAAYRIAETPPLSCTYRGNLVLAPPPPSSGGTTLCEILNVLEGYDLHAMGFHTPMSVHVMAEAMRRAFFDRNSDLGDPAFVQNPLQALLSKDYAARLRKQITDRATPSADLGPATGRTGEKRQTTHYSVIDKNQNAVSVTYTINGGFGAGVIAADTGFLLNDEMDDFTVKPGTPNLFGLVQGAANAIAPGKRPLSSMAPTIVLKDGQVRMVTGSPGGSRIITIVLETILNTIDHQMPPQQAVDAPRLHLQWLPDVLYEEPSALSPETRQSLERMGYRIEQRPAWGAAETITARPLPPGSAETAGSKEEGVFYGTSDPRRPAGAALAP